MRELRHTLWHRLAQISNKLPLLLIGRVELSVLGLKRPTSVSLPLVRRTMRRQRRGRLRRARRRCCNWRRRSVSLCCGHCERVAHPLAMMVGRKVENKLSFNRDNLNAKGRWVMYFKSRSIWRVFDDVSRSYWLRSL